TVPVVPLIDILWIRLFVGSVAYKVFTPLETSPWGKLIAADRVIVWATPAELNRESVVAELLNEPLFATNRSCPRVTPGVKTPVARRNNPTTNRWRVPGDMTHSGREGPGLQTDRT